MKIYTLIAISILALTSSVMGQGRGKLDEPMRGKVLEFKKEYFKEQLALDDSNMDKFWAVYVKYDDQRMAKRKEMHNLRTGVIALSDDQIKERLDRMIKIREEEVDLEKAYYADLKSILNYRQIMALVDAEQNMKMILLRRLKDEHRREHGAPPSRRGGGRP